MKLSDWAREQGIAYQTAWIWYKDGKLPVPAEQMPSGTIILSPPKVHDSTDAVVIYARVSSHDQKEDMGRQVSRLKEYAAANGWKVG